MGFEPASEYMQLNLKIQHYFVIIIKNTEEKHHVPNVAL